MSLIYLFSLILSITAQAERQSGMRCTTTQQVTYPVKAPNDAEFTHTVKVTMDDYREVLPEDQRIGASQAAWKTCRNVLGAAFAQDWKNIGIEPNPPRPPLLCTTSFVKPDLYACEHVTRESSEEEDRIVLVEAQILN